MSVLLGNVSGGKQALHSLALSPVQEVIFSIHAKNYLESTVESVISLLSSLFQPILSQISVVHIFSKSWIFHGSCLRVFCQ